MRLFLWFSNTVSRVNSFFFNLSKILQECNYVHCDQVWNKSAFFILKKQFIKLRKNRKIAKNHKLRKKIEDFFRDLKNKNKIKLRKNRKIVNKSKNREKITKWKKTLKIFFHDFKIKIELWILVTKVWFSFLFFGQKIYFWNSELRGLIITSLT